MRARHQHEATAMTRLFLVDDEPGVQRALRLLISTQPALEVCGQAGTERDAVEGILASRPDVAVVDLTLKEGNGLALIEQVHQRCPAVKLLVFSAHDRALLAAHAFAVGAHGYLLKEEGTEHLLEAIQTVMRGERYLSTLLAAKAPGLAVHLRDEKRRAA
jgi:DNA-binding NarL/FixJ family response regulator